MRVFLPQNMRFHPYAPRAKQGNGGSQHSLVLSQVCNLPPPNPLPIFFILQRCLICDSCEKPFETLNFQEGSLLCNLCKEFREKKEFCRVCNKPCIKPSVKIENKKLLKDWILCSICSNWVHRFCDNALRDDKTYSEFGKSNKDYSCPLCRNELTNQKLKEFINIISRLIRN